MEKEPHIKKAQSYLRTLCSQKPHRSTGSKGNKRATEFFRKKLASFGFTTHAQSFTCLDYVRGKSELIHNKGRYGLISSPFSLGCDITSELVVASNLKELKQCACENKILLLKDEICAEQLMPKKFVFYNPDHHKELYALIEGKRPGAIITATGRNPQVAGGIYPFPLFDDGDFDIPSAYCKDTLGERLSRLEGKEVRIKISSRRIPSSASNIIGRKNADKKRKIVVCAHIDSKETTPGATDNASGIVTLLLLAEMLKNYTSRLGLEIIAFNGEDHYSAGGQMQYLKKYAKDFKHISLVINVDGAGYKKGKTAYSLYNCSDEIGQLSAQIFGKYKGMMKGDRFFQGDHMLFVQKNVAAIACTSERCEELLATITHSSKDTPEIVDCSKLVELAGALSTLILRLGENYAG